MWLFYSAIVLCIRTDKKLQRLNPAVYNEDDIRFCPNTQSSWRRRGWVTGPQASSARLSTSSSRSKFLAKAQSQNSQRSAGGLGQQDRTGQWWWDMGGDCTWVWTTMGGDYHGLRLTIFLTLFWLGQVHIIHQIKVLGKGPVTEFLCQGRLAQISLLG